jgi:putative transposase
MPRKTKTNAVAAETPELEVSAELLDQLVRGPMSQGDLETMFRSLKKAVIERAMGAEMNQHLGYKAGEARPAGQSNHRNGSSAKTDLTDDGAVRIEVPRDREGSFEPQIVGKHERRFSGFDQKIVAMYARGMTVREIQGYLAEMYGTEVSPEFISQVTEEVMAEVIAWQSRPLEALYPVVFFDALRIKIRDRVSGPGGVARRQPRRAGHLDRTNRGGKVLAQGLQRPEDPRLQRHPDRRGGRPQGAR